MCEGRPCSTCCHWPVGQGLICPCPLELRSCLGGRGLLLLPCNSEFIFVYIGVTYGEKGW